MSTSYLRGAFIAYEPDGYPERKRVIPFRFNPESVGRQLAVEQGQSGQGTDAAGASGAGSSKEQGAPDSSSGSLKQTLTVQVRFDFADRHEASSDLDERLGVAPEIAVVEDLLYPAEAESEQPNQGGEPVQPRARRPIVLFVWGRKRVFPVRITQMTINETMYNADLNPVRAEIDISMEVLGERDASNFEAVRRALEHTDSKRRELARMFLDKTKDQGSNILPL